MLPYIPKDFWRTVLELKTFASEASARYLDLSIIEKEAAQSSQFIDKADRRVDGPQNRVRKLLTITSILNRMIAVLEARGGSPRS